MKNIKSIIAIATLLPFLCIANPIEYKWELNKNLIIISQSYTLESNYLVQSFILDYVIDRDCHASASILSVANSKTLGKYKSKNMIKSNKKENQLIFFVDGKEIKYRQEKIMKVIYENGFEFGTIAPPELITALDKSNGNLEVFLEGIKLIKITNSKGFSENNKKAYDYCLRNKK